MHLAAAYLSLACRLEPGPALQLLLARRGLAANEAAHKLPQAITPEYCARVVKQYMSGCEQHSCPAPPTDGSLVAR